MQAVGRRHAAACGNPTTDLDDALDIEDLAEEPRPPASPLIVMVQDDAALAGAIAERLRREGHAAHLVAGAQTSLPGTEPHAAAVMIIDLRTAPGGEGPAEGMPCRTDPLAAPLIYISSRDDMQARLAAQRLGATRYLTQPLDMDRLMLMVDAHLLRMPERPFRVLLVEGDAARLERHAAHLRAAGMEVEAVSDPLQMLTAAVRMRPECIVLEREMAGLSGEVLAAVLRADARFLDTPIVYLMGPAVAERVLPLLEGGGETCLPSGVSCDALAACITLRIRRARSLRRMNEDLRAALRESRFLRLALDVHTLVCITDASGVIAYVNDALCRASGYKRRELLGQSIRLLQSDRHPPEFHSALWQTLNRGEVWQGELCNRRKDGSLYWVNTSIIPAMDEGARPTRYLFVGTETTRLNPDFPLGRGKA
jgi:PAS domain S-box-containing protein